MRRPSLRWMVLGPVLATITIGFVVLALYIDRVEQANRIADVDEELLRAERSSVLPGPGGRPRPGNDAGTPPNEVEDGEGDDGGIADSAAVDPPVQLLVLGDGSVLESFGGTHPFGSAVLAALAQQDGALVEPTTNHRVRVTRLDDGLVSVTALSLDDSDAASTRFRRALVVGAVAVLGLVTLVVWFVTSALVRPVSRLAGAASRIADGELDTVVPPLQGSREVVDLADDLDRMMATLRTTLDQRARAAADATAARDDMRRFLADMTHELRTPLTALKGYSDLHAAGMLAEDDALDRAMSRIGSESDRLHDLATDMLQLARGEVADFALERVDLVAVTEAVVHDLVAAHPDRRIELDRPSTPCEVMAHPGRLHQAILNLGSNAVRHTTPGTPVEVVVEAAPDAATIHVIDHGPGVADEDVERIFLPFYRAERSRSREGRGGAGLGLALTQQIVTQHHGRVSVGTTEGGGATFTMTVPTA